MKRFIILFSVCLITACASVNQVMQRNNSPTHIYRLAGETQSHEIGGMMEAKLTDSFTGATAKLLSVYIDGEQVAFGQLDNTYSGQITGFWNDKKIDAICSSQRTSKTWISIKCITLINNEKTGTLTF
jgi:hypothetical protein